MKKSLLTLFFALLVAMAAVAETTYSKALEEKAIKGDADAMLELSTCYRFAMGVKKDLSWANYWLERAAKAGSTKALTVLTSLGDAGTGLSDAKRRELDTIVQRKQKDLGVDNRVIGAQIDYSTYNDALYREAQRGDTKAQDCLGVCYFSGKGVAQDYTQAVYWYRKAAEQGYAPAQNHLGVCYSDGEGVTKDHSLAAYWYRKAAEQGNAWGQYNLGYNYKVGRGVTQDYSQAVYWYRKAAEQGIADAQNGLGYCYQHAQGVEKDYYQAVYWYRKAAEQDNESAQGNLGACYFKGEGVTQDYSQAVYWFRKAADQNNATAQSWLGQCYEEGKGVTKDISKAIEYYRKAASKNIEYAQDALKRLGADGGSGNNQTFTVGGVSFTMVYVEGGTFTMGATSEQAGDAESIEYPTHTVYLSSYYIGETEVTQELWEAVMGSNTSSYKGGLLPVENMTWDECQTFIRKLNARTGKNFRLPTEAEWEYAARGGKKSRGYKYSGSNNLSDVGWYSKDNGTTHPVAMKRPNELGLYDMSGNVYEWCYDKFERDYYKSSPYSNPQGPSTGTRRVRRGGSWYNDTSGCRVSFRNSWTQDNQNGTLGLRLAL